MAEELGNYKISAGTKIEYSEDKQTWTQIKGATSIPQLLGTPEAVDSTTLDNLKNKTSIPGLQEMDQIEIPFNTETPEDAANINVVASLDTSKTLYWRVTYGGTKIVVIIKSKPSFYFNEVGTNEIESFTLVLTPEDDLEVTIPTATSQNTTSSTKSVKE